MALDDLESAVFVIDPPRRGRKPGRVAELDGKRRSINEVRGSGYRVDGYTVIAISLYSSDLERIDRLSAKRGGGRSALIREALLRMDLALGRETAEHPGQEG